MGGQISYDHAAAKFSDEKLKKAAPRSQHSSHTQKEGADSRDCVATPHGVGKRICDISGRDR
eukprot:6973509-Pyramimonas_sp.AAC.1